VHVVGFYPLSHECNFVVEYFIFFFYQYILYHCL